jgi:hypothetical protein
MLCTSIETGSSCQDDSKESIQGTFKEEYNLAS